MRLILFPLAALLACSPASGPREGSVRSGTFHYVARNSLGRPLLVGELTLSERSDSSFAGTWEIHWAPGADTTTEVGPQVGTGTLSGWRLGSDLRLDLNPGNADHNVYLQATPRADGYTGDWSWSTITGPRTSGTFAATE